MSRGRRAIRVAATVLLLGGLMSAGAVVARADDGLVALARVDGGSPGLSNADFVEFSGQGLPPDTVMWVRECYDHMTLSADPNATPDTPIDVPWSPTTWKDTTPLGTKKIKLSASVCDAKPGLSDPGIGNNYAVRTGHDGSVTAHLYAWSGAKTGKVQVGQTYSYQGACDPDHSCRVVLVGQKDFKVYASLPLTFAKPATASCGAASDGTATGAGPFSMTTTAQVWAVASCAKGKATPLLADYTETGEQAGLQQFQLGNNDFAFSAVGFKPPDGESVQGDRAALFVPVAMQAAVVAFEGNITTPLDTAGVATSTRLTRIAATVPELATLYGGDSDTASSAIVTRAGNDQLTAAYHQTSDTTPAGIVHPGGALAVPDATTLSVTASFSKWAPDSWLYGTRQRYPAEAKAPLQASNYPSLYSGVSKAAFDAQANPANGARLYLLDSVSAARLGLTAVSVRNTGKQFVAPTPESMAAAAKNMLKGEDGTLRANPDDTEPAAYPWPMVMYAVVPAAAFDHRAALVDYLTHVLGDGQKSLPKGLYPLPADLLSQAKAALPKVGAGTGTPPGQPPGDTGPGTGGTDSTLLASTAGAIGGLATNSPGANGAHETRDTNAQDVKKAADTLAIPRFLSLESLGRLLPVFGLLVLVAMVSGLAYTSSGRPLPAQLSRPAAWLRRQAAHAVRLIPRRSG